MKRLLCGSAWNDVRNLALEFIIGGIIALIWWICRIPDPQCAPGVIMHHRYMLLVPAALLAAGTCILYVFYRLCRKDLEEEEAGMPESSDHAEGAADTNR